MTSGTVFADRVVGQLTPPAGRGAWWQLTLTAAGRASVTCGFWADDVVRVDRVRYAVARVAPDAVGWIVATPAAWAAWVDRAAQAAG